MYRTHTKNNYHYEIPLKLTIYQSSITIKQRTLTVSGHYLPARSSVSRSACADSAPPLPCRTFQRPGSATNSIGVKLQQQLQAHGQRQQVFNINLKIN